MNKYLEKVAKFTPGHAIAAGAAVGAGLGGWAGHHEKTKRVNAGWFKTKVVNKSKVERVMDGVGGAVAGAYLGAAAGFHLHPGKRKWFDEQMGKNHGGGYGGYRSAGNARTARTVNDIKKDLGLPANIKTKAEAKKHFRAMASKHHPDKHEGAHKEAAGKKMADLNRAWDEFQQHPDGFTKLANTYLTKIAAINIAKVKQIVKTNPGAVIGGALGATEGAGSTLKLKRDNELKYRLRQLKNTVVGAGFGAATGKVVQEGLKSISK